MMTSMTGFGQAARSLAGFRLQIDLKSVNHRYCEVVVRMPREWARYEDAVKRAVLARVKRGRVDAFVSVERDGKAPQAVEVDWALAMGYRQAAEQMREKLSLSEELSLRDLLSIPGMVSLKDKPELEDEVLERELFSCADEAAKELVTMREREGEVLLADLEQRIGVMESYRLEAVQLAPIIVKEYAGKLKSRIQELLQHMPLDENRLAMEVALFADRAAIDEELTRLNSHFGQFKKLLRSAEPVGRKLDFLVQEINREVNTIGSKANYAPLSSIVVEMKAELEKMREQIQNIE
ncbi:YicC family protein [Paenibacillus sp. JMULE4]|nr:YicC/YloC family endoribonuclease [Paenibacillus sp. JMULE4]NTZ18292.1 YicC family protein [Paenibacillus sp. JMULE4]